MAWNPTQYLKFAGHRLRPALDLLARVSSVSPQAVFDLGAGAGNVTRLLHDRWPDAKVVGVESSADMIARGRDEAPHVHWQQADLATWKAPDRADVIFSNAALHWLGGHDRLFPDLLDMLKPGGILAVQMPRNFSAPSHTAIAAAAASGPWRDKLAPLLRPVPVSEPGDYYDWLAPRCKTLDIWEAEYLQILEGEDPVKEWTKGTWLKPLLDALDEPQRSDFEVAYARLVASAYPKRADGHTLFPFRRLFIVATV